VQTGSLISILMSKEWLHDEFAERGPGK